MEIEDVLEASRAQYEDVLETSSAQFNRLMKSFAARWAHRAHLQNPQDPEGDEPQGADPHSWQLGHAAGPDGDDAGPDDPSLPP